jgi:hypothetical protein
MVYHIVYLSLLLLLLLLLRHTDQIYWLPPLVYWMIGFGARLWRLAPFAPS